MEPGEEDFDPRLNYHTLVRVGFLNETISPGTGHCSKDQIDTECANAVRDEQTRAAEECSKRLENIQNTAANDRAEREGAERECADKLYAERQTITRIKRECAAELSKEIAERNRAVQEEQERMDRKCRMERDRVIQGEKDRIERQCEADRKLAVEGERDAAARKCATDMEQALQGERIQGERKCEVDLARAVQEEKERVERQCKVDKDHALQDERRQCNIDQARAVEDEKKRTERTCEAERDAALRDQKTTVERQCKTEKDRAVQDEQERVERKCELDRERLQQTERETCQRQSATDLERAIRDERDRADKECTDRFQQEQARRGDDISFNPGFQAWPENIADFDIDGATYVLRVRSRVDLAATMDHDTTSPAACVRTYCNSDPLCFGIGWDPRKENRCTTYMDSPYRAIKARDIDSYPHQNMIVKRDRMA
ncbi:hypothetical protein PG999_007327 [Apiospora kogelbergensis]|uniref:Uncharacterized protein n=1 Tax=Apiospora kogelbergensis TaxID=1337665 RepID=A0AAW0QY46_9PEZI